MGPSTTSFGYLEGETASVFTDIHEIRMMQVDLNQGHTPRSTFNLFFRDLNSSTE